MNKFARDYLMMRRGRDMRNPYGSRGGYVVSDRAMNDMARGRDYAEDMARGRGRDYADYADYSDYARGQNQYTDNAMGNDYSGYGRWGYDYADYGDYANGQDGHQKLARRELKKWEKGLENADGTKGAKWQVDQIKQIAQQHGIKFDEYRPETFAVVMNALYADYAKVLGADPSMYAKLTKAWLEDDDFDGEPEEKAMLYYKCIVAKDD